LLHPDFRDMLSELNSSEVDFMLVGAYAMAAHGFPRSTGDIDIWIRADEETAPKVYDCLVRFGAPMHVLTVSDLSKPGMIFQIGVPPVRIDILTKIDGVLFEEAWKNRLKVVWDGLDVQVIGLEDLIENKRSTGRTKDVADVERLERPADQSE
jgi:predicted nucleotidyltransferase